MDIKINLIGRAALRLPERVCGAVLSCRRLRCACSGRRSPAAPGGVPAANGQLFRPSWWYGRGREGAGRAADIAGSNQPVGQLVVRAAQTSAMASSPSATAPPCPWPGHDHPVHAAGRPPQQPPQPSPSRCRPPRR